MIKIKLKDYINSINRKSIFCLEYSTKDERYHVIEIIEPNHKKNRDTFYETKNDAIIGAAQKTITKSRFYYKQLWRYEYLNKITLYNFFIILKKQLTPKEHQKKFYSAQSLFLFAKHYINKDIKDIESETEIKNLPEYIFLTDGQNRIKPKQSFYKLHIDFNLNNKKPIVFNEQKLETKAIKQTFHQNSNEDFLRTEIIVYLSDLTSFYPIDNEEYISKNSDYFIFDNYQNMKKFKQKIQESISKNKGLN